MYNRCQKEKLKNRVRIIGEWRTTSKKWESRAGGGGMKSKKAFCLPCCISGRVYVYMQSRKLLCICGGPLHPEFTLKPGKRVDVRHTCSKSLSGLHNTHTSGGKKKTSRCVSINHSAATTTEGSTTKDSKLSKKNSNNIKLDWSERTVKK
jgi:hypothetical protein